MSPAFTLTTIAELEAAMDALSLQEGGNTVASNRTMIQNKISRDLSASGCEASYEISKHALAIVDDFCNVTAPTGPSSDREYSVWHALGSIFYELGQTASEQRHSTMQLVAMNEGQATVGSEDREWMQAVESAMFDAEDVVSLARDLITEISAADVWSVANQPTLPHLSEVPEDCKVLSALSAAVGLARVMFERESLRRHLAVSVLSNQRKTLETIRKVEDIGSAPRVKRM